VQPTAIRLLKAHTLPKARRRQSAHLSYHAIGANDVPGLWSTQLLDKRWGRPPPLHRRFAAGADTVINKSRSEYREPSVMSGAIMICDSKRFSKAP